MVFRPDTETQVLSRLRDCLVPDGPLVVGFHTDRHLSLTDFDQYAAAAGWRLEHRFATWDLKAWHQDADFAVSVLR